MVLGICLTISVCYNLEDENDGREWTRWSWGKSILSGEKVDMCVTVNSPDSLRSY